MELDEDAFKSRDKVMCVMLFVFGMINFSCYIRDKDKDTAEKLWTSASFITMFGALIALIIQGFGWRENKLALCIALFLLMSGCIIMVASAGQWSNDYCGSDDDDFKNQCELYVFGAVSLPGLVCIVVALDLFSAKFMKKRRIRLCIFTLIVFTASILLSVHFYEKSNMDSDDKSSEAAFSVLMGISAFTFLVHGIFGLSKFAILNVFCAFVFCSGLFLLLADDLACVSVALAWWMVLAAVIFLILMDINEGDIIGVYRHTQPKSKSVPKAEKKEEKEEKKEDSVREKSVMDERNPFLSPSND